jgi:NAD-dependent deacetylase
VTVVTQNIDGLHQEAGSHCVWEVHGSAFSVVTLTGEPVRRIERQELQEIVDRLHGAIHPVFDRSTAWQAVLPIISVDPERICRPNIVLFGEAMAEPDWSRATEAAEECDCLLMVGTSGVVYPAAMLPEQAKSAGADIIAVDPARGFCDVWLQGTAATMLPKLVGWIEDEVQD